jgi:predicted site-specific integrase-resolvase
MTYLNSKEVSRLLKCSQKTIQRRIRNGELVPINPQHTSGYLFKKTEIDLIVKKRKEGDNNV